jgi:hypothetical protein
VNLVKKIPFRNEFSEIPRFLEFQLKSLGNVAIRLGEEATEETVLRESPDAVVIATGSTRFVDSPSRSAVSCSSWDVLRGAARIGRNVVIYDKLAKDEGIGVAEYIAEYYEEASIRFFTPAHFPGADVHFLNLDVLFRKLFSKNISFHPFSELTGASDGRVTFMNRYSRKSLTVEDCDTLVVIGDMRSNDELYTRLRGRISDLHRVGDARAPRIVEMAIRGAEELARAL